MRREPHVRFCEGPGVKFPRATRLVEFATSGSALAPRLHASADSRNSYAHGAADHFPSHPNAPSATAPEPPAVTRHARRPHGFPRRTRLPLPTSSAHPNNASRRRRSSTSHAANAPRSLLGAGLGRRRLRRLR
jgi:hypothetical protein